MELTRQQVRQKAWYARNKHKVIARANAWRKANPTAFKDAVRKYRKKHPEMQREGLWRRRGVEFTQEEYLKLVEEQQGLCKICSRPPQGKRRLALDHDHQTGRVRGLLCTRCNLALPLLEDYLTKPSVREAADKYLEIV